MNQLYPFGDNVWVLVIILIWSLFWKGLSLWIAVKNNQSKWFIALLILNTLGILDMIYIFFVMKKSWNDIEKMLGIKAPVQKE